MTSLETGGPAFPVCDAARIHNLEGISIRDYFAAKAMQGELASQSPENEYTNLDAIAALSYRMADAMLKAREAQ